MTCADGNHTGLYWYPAANEEGWLCVDCEVKPGEPPGYSPQHDRSHLREKVWSLVHELADAKLISVSNSSHGEGLADAVTRRLHGSNRLDQYTILAAIIDAERIEHADYWSKISTAILRGEDPRHRCACGALACVSSSSGGSDWVRTCGKGECEHHRATLPADGGPF